MHKNSDSPNDYNCNDYLINNNNANTNNNSNNNIFIESSYIKNLVLHNHIKMMITIKADINASAFSLIFENLETSEIYLGRNRKYRVGHAIPI